MMKFFTQLPLFEQRQLLYPNLYENIGFQLSIHKKQTNSHNDKIKSEGLPKFSTLNF